MLETQALYIFTTETEDPDATTHARMFAPTLGVAEDPATGSASGPLGCYLVRHGISDGHAILCEQGYEIGRPSSIKVHISHTQGAIETVQVSGDTVFVGKGCLFTD
jgi:trans-2,3-dihydro-3-hydroxyanthranilate isomerase